MPLVVVGDVVYMIGEIRYATNGEIHCMIGEFRYKTLSEFIPEPSESLSIVVSFCCTVG